MELRVGDRITDETGEWEIIGRPYTMNAGKDAHARVGTGRSTRCHRDSDLGRARARQREERSEMSENRQSEIFRLTLRRPRSPSSLRPFSVADFLAFLQAGLIGYAVGRVHQNMIQQQRRRGEDDR
jgi:hypothetical protein